MVCPGGFCLSWVSFLQSPVPSLGNSRSQPKRMHVARLGGRRGSLRAALTPALPVQPRAKSSIEGETEARRAAESNSPFGKYNRHHFCHCTS